jgi:helicase
MQENYTIKIPTATREPVLDVALDTIAQDKQAIVFVNSKRSAESVAEKVAKKSNITDKEKEFYNNLSEKILKALATPTRQCKRLALCIQKGIAFHHAGLNSTQRRLVEQNFREKKIKVICATPTLAQGVDLPAYRTIIRDLKRFTSRGMRSIPVLEYEQQAGRAGRPGQETLGQAIVFAKDKKDKKYLIKKYLNGDPEDIISKLAVEPILRSYVLSLVATDYCKNFKELEEFFSKTFFAHQYQDDTELSIIMSRTLEKLKEWKFVTIQNKETSGFVSAKDYKNSNTARIRATILGKRVSELYLDPYTANFMISYLKENKIKPISLLFMFANCIEIKPLLNVGVNMVEDTEAWLQENEEELGKESELMQDDYYELTRGIRTTMFFADWIEEFNEEELLEKYNVRPGEINSKVERLDWLIYSATELTRLTNKDLVKYLIRLRIRTRNGCKEELIPLLKFKNVGRVRARRLFKNNIKNVHDVKVIAYEKLSAILGKKLALDMKKEVNINVKDVQETLL